MITAEMLQERLSQLTAERDQMQRNLFAYDGAIQDCVHWLEIITLAKTMKAEKVKENAWDDE